MAEGADQPTEFQPVKNSHVVPRAYLKAWTDDNNVACVHPVKPPPGAPPGVPPKPKKKGVSGIAVRECFYARERPNGETFHDVEWSLGQGENATAPLLKRIRGLWPLSEENKAAVAELLALQVVRVPHEIARMDSVVEAGVQDYVAAASTGTAAEDFAVEVGATRDDFLSRTHQMTRMLKHARIGLTFLGSMRWALVEFDQPLLASSDHPVHIWPLAERTLRPDTKIVAGVGESLEVKWPLSPSLALVGCWSDLPDIVEPLPGTPQLASSLNSFVIAAAEEQWIHRTDAEPPYEASDRTIEPWSPGLIEGYSQQYAAASLRRRAAAHFVQPMLGTREVPKRFRIFYLPPKA